MIGTRETGIVVGLDEAKVRVRITPMSEDACASCGGCGAAEADGTRLLEIDSTGGLTVGATVVVETAPVSHLAASVLLLLVPLIGLLVGAFVGQASGPRLGLGSEVGAIVGGLVVLALGFAAIAFVDRRIRHRSGGAGPRIISIRTS